MQPWLWVGQESWFLTRKLLTSWKFSYSPGWAKGALEKGNTYGTRALPGFLTLDGSRLSGSAARELRTAPHRGGCPWRRGRIQGSVVAPCHCPKRGKWCRAEKSPPRPQAQTTAWSTGECRCRCWVTLRPLTLNQLLKREKFVATTLCYQIRKTGSSHSENPMI